VAANVPLIQARPLAYAASAKALSLALLAALFARQGDFRLRGTTFLSESGIDGRGRAEEIASSFWFRSAPYDGQFYLDIASRGYRTFERRERGIPRGNYAFFPLLPALVRVLGLHGAYAAIHLATIASACLIWRVSEDAGVPPFSAMLLFLLFPSAAFCDVLYTEALFVALTLSAYLFAARARVAPTAAIGTLIGLCRPQGVLAVALISGAWLEAGGFRKRGWPLSALACLSPVLGLASFASLLAFDVGDPLGFVTIQEDWGRDFSVLSLLSGPFGVFGPFSPPVDRASFFLFLATLPVIWSRLPRSMAVYSTLLFLVPAVTGSTMSFGRFCFASFPSFMALALVTRGRSLALLSCLSLFVTFRVLLAEGLIAWKFVG